MAELQRMPDAELYALYDALECLRHLSGHADLIFVDLMKQHKDAAINGVQQAIVDTIRERRQ